MRRVLLLFAGLLALAGVAVASSGGATQVQPRWVITDLGTLGPDDSTAYAVNGRGQVVGESDTGTQRDPNGDRWGHAFLWENGMMHDLGSLPHLNYSAATAINERGQVVGYSYLVDKNGDPQQLHAVLWQKGRLTDIGILYPQPCYREVCVAINGRGDVVLNSYVAHGKERAVMWQAGRRAVLPTLGGSKSAATDINDDGQIVGVTTRRDGVSRAALWQNGRVRDLGTLGGASSEAYAINELGQVVGWSKTKKNVEHAFLWQNGKMRDLGTLGGPGSAAWAINDRGQVVGRADTKAKDKYGDHLNWAFLWQNGKMRNLGSLGGPDTFVDAINDRGQVVGKSYTRDKDEYGEYSTGHAFVWQKGAMTDLGTLPGGEFWSWAVAINAKGDEIVGHSYVQGGLSHAVLWTLKR